MNKQILILVCALLLACLTLLWSRNKRWEAETKLEIATREIEVLKYRLDSVREESELTQENFADALELREAEISYWGRICEKMQKKFPQEAESVKREVKREMGFE
jgi:DNA-binding transcriptional regulator YiaG